ncbi:MAG: AEC family transporter [Actinomycetota bacterium]
MGDILVTTFALVTIIVIGYAIRRLGWVDISAYTIISKIVMRVTLPALIVTSFNDYDIDPSLLILPLLALVVILIQQLTGVVMERRNGGKAQAFGVINIGYYNIGNFAVPYLSGFLGAQAVVYASMFDIGNALAAMGIGFAWAMTLAREETRFSATRFLKDLLKSPVFDTYVVMLALRFLDLSFPDPVIAFTSTAGAANTFLSMLMLGIALEIRLERRSYGVALKYLTVRYALAVPFALGAWYLVPLDEPIRVVLCTLLFAPLGGMAPVLTSYVGGDLRLSNFILSASVVVGVVAMPTVLALLT